MKKFDSMLGTKLETGFCLVLTLVLNRFCEEALVIPHLAQIIMIKKQAPTKYWVGIMVLNPSTAL